MTVDAHVHLITFEMVEDFKNRFSSVYPAAKKVIEETSKKIIHPEFINYLSTVSLRDQAEKWLKAMDDNGIDRAVFFPISERPEQILEFVKTAPERFVGYMYIDNPLEPDAPERLRKAAQEQSLVGLKLYPPTQLFHAYDKRLFPLYDEAQSLGIPITFHFGITHAPVADFHYINPLDMRLPLTLFPKLNFIVAHFGAGFFRELCLLSYHAENLYVDTSGTNNWRDFTPERLPLREIFKTTLELFTPDRVIFGTDTVLRSETGYRTAIKKEQEEIVDSLGLSAEDVDKVFGGNATRLYRI
ncbi:MAG: amidohydrolase family protein [Nitrospinota bacterium]